MSKFKVGDEVYFPSRGLGIYKLERNRSPTYPFKIDGSTFTLDGKPLCGIGLPSIYHATDENKNALELLMGVDFEAPKKKGSALTRQMLSESDVPVLCYVSDISEEFATSDDVCVRLVVSASKHCFTATNGYNWIYAVPFDKVIRTALT